MDERTLRIGPNGLIAHVAEPDGDTQTVAYWRRPTIVPHERPYLTSHVPSSIDGAATGTDVRGLAAAHEELAAIASAFTSELDHGRLVQKITDIATALCRAQFGAFFHNVEDESGASYMLYTLSGAARSAFEKFPMPRRTGVFGPTFAGTAVVRSDDITKDPRYGKNDPHFGMPKGHLPVRSYLAVPVRSRSGAILGGLFFGHADVGVFTARDERMIVGVAAQAAVALDNANLFRAVQHAEASAAAEREKLRGLFRQAPALIVIMKGPEHLYDFVNDAARALVAHPDPLGRPIREVLPNLPAERLATLDEVFATGKRWVGEAVPSSQGGVGANRFFHVVYEPYRGADGRIEGIMSFGFDVSEQVAATRRLEAIARELETANRTKDEFLATVSHELRTPLNAILGWVRMLRAGTLPPEKVERALETIERNANAQTQLIEDLLDVSRIISGKLRLDVTDVDVRAVVENAIEAVRPAAQAKQVALRLDVDADIEPLVGDANRLQQVVWNLLTNAVRFTPQSGHVDVRVTKAGSSLAVAVQDDGQGIDAEFLPLVFERFRQLDATTSRKHGGLGLGLAIVRHLVELHGGVVGVTSEGLGKGTTFTVTLPSSSARAMRLEQPPALRPGRPTGSFERPRILEGAHVLVVDDERDARELLAEMLVACKARVTTASCAAEAIACVGREKPDVIVSDIGMPDEDGYSFIRRVRALPKEHGGKTPAVALTAYARLEDRSKALVAGFNMHVPKPVEPSELLAALSGLLQMFVRD